MPTPFVIFLIGAVAGVILSFLVIRIMRVIVDEHALHLEEVFITVAAIVIVGLAVLQQFDVFDTVGTGPLSYDFYLPVFLATLGVFLVFQFKRLQARLEGLGPLTRMSGVCPTRRFPHSHDAFRRLTTLIREADASIDQVAIAATPALPKSLLRRYLDAMRGQAKNDTLTYRWICGDNYPARVERLRAFRTEGERFFVKIFQDASAGIPSLNFAVFDKKRVFVRYPNDPAGKEVYLELESPEVAELFTEYYETLWNAAPEDSA